MNARLLIPSTLLALLCGLPCHAQMNNGTNAPVDENPKPTWETQKQARTFQLGIPAPRGQITDRNGYPFAQSRLSYNLALQFPSPLDWKDAKVISFARQQITFAKGFLGRQITVSDQAILNHYRNRGLLPLALLEDLRPEERAHQCACPPASLCPFLSKRGTRLSHHRLHRQRGPALDPSD